MEGLGEPQKQRLFEPVETLAVKLVKWSLQLRLFRRRTLWCPTWTGSGCVLLIFVALAVACFNWGESYLAFTQRAQADTLVVEGWIGRTGVDAAAAEFRRGGYRYIVCTGGFTSDQWAEEPKSFAEMAAAEMIRLGIPEASVLTATAEITETHRTFESAVAVWRTLRNAGIKPEGINVFTFGPHARRSELVFTKVNWPVTSIGVIGWSPPGFWNAAWWQSSDRSRELLEETAGYGYEVLLNSGRPTNLPN